MNWAIVVIWIGSFNPSLYRGGSAAPEIHFSMSLMSAPTPAFDAACVIARIRILADQISETGLFVSLPSSFPS